MERIENWPGQSFIQPGCRLQKNERLVEVETVNYFIYRLPLKELCYILSLNILCKSFLPLTFFRLTFEGSKSASNSGFVMVISSLGLHDMYWRRLQL